MQSLMKITDTLEQAERLLVQFTRDHEKGECDCGLCLALNHLWVTIAQVEMATKQSGPRVPVVNRIRNLFSQN